MWIAYSVFILIAIFGFALDRLAFAIGGPLWAFRTGATGAIDSVFSYMKSKSSLENQVKELEKKLDEKESEIILTKGQLDLYKGLDDYVAKRDPSKNERVVRVVTRPPQTPFDVLIIDVGTTEVSKGQQVFYAGVPVGTIDSITGPYAKVILMSHPSSEFRVLIGPKKIEGEAKGKSQGNILVTLPKSSDIKEGDVVYLAEGTVPFGSVSKIDDGSSQSFADVYIALPFSPLLADWLSVYGN